MATIVSYTASPRRLTQALLLLLAIAIGVGAYALVGLGRHHELPENLLVYGIGAGVVFATLALAFGLGVGTLVGGLVWGVVWGLVLFGVGAVFWMRMVLGVDPDMGMIAGFGFFHLVYGVVLGAWVGLGVLG